MANHIDLVPQLSSRNPGCEVRRRAPLGDCFRIAVVLSACSALACDPERVEPPPGAPNILIVLLDTVRADKLGCLGSKLGITPRIDELALSSALFTQSFSHAPWTLPSVGSLLTSNYPEVHGAGGYLGAKFTALSDSVPTLGESLRSKGYSTGAIVNVFFLDPRFKLNRGFEDYDFVAPSNNQKERRATATTDAAVTWLGQHKEDTFFLMVHYFDAHLTYDPPQPFRSKFAPKSDAASNEALFGTEQDMVDLRSGKRSLSSIPVDRLSKLYDGEIAYVDFEVGRLLDELRKLGLERDTIVVLTADHGEEFLDHGGFEHGHTMYVELLHVPLMIRYPESIKPVRIEQTVRHLDVAPTLLELAGLAAEPGFAGESLTSMMTGSSGPDRFVLSQGNMWGPSLTSLRSEGYKLIRREERAELYHVKVDNKEKLNILDDPSSAKVRDELQAAIDGIHKLSQGRGSSQPALDLNPTELNALRSLGYVHGPAGDGGRLPSTQTGKGK